MTNKISVILFLCVLIWKENAVEGKFKFSLKWESSHEPKEEVPVKNLPSIQILQNTDLAARNLPKFRNSVYDLGFDFQGNWYDAAVFCKSRNMSLVSIESEEENAFLYELMKQRYGESMEYWFWTSGIQRNNRWVWTSTGRPIEYFNWMTYQPDNQRSQENCIEMRYNWYTGMRWNDRNGLDCGVHALCEAEIEPVTPVTRYNWFSRYTTPAVMRYTTPVILTTTAVRRDTTPDVSDATPVTRHTTPDIWDTATDTWDITTEKNSNYTDYY
ncbi:uncharacterized protein LOC114324755 [Diabrotica virgifera virgifera]|uniref:Uncharacterized protein LOC114324755 n=1 Tax=Diabrotica virgifera virgifera TaxID=50390 RepID=A0A6P7F3F1_DIAVI|nr:uncharacterized protein LOC114324755 [Diabrotica virgifera virgifera]